MIYDKHIFICTNQRAPGTRVCCGEENGLKLVAEFKKQLKDKKLPIAVRAQKSGCLDICEHGPSLVVYPDGVFYKQVQLTDISEIIDSHIMNNIPVERIVLRKADLVK